MTSLFVSYSQNVQTTKVYYLKDDFIKRNHVFDLWSTFHTSKTFGSYKGVDDMSIHMWDNVFTHGVFSHLIFHVPKSLTCNLNAKLVSYVLDTCKSLSQEISCDFMGKHWFCPVKNDHVIKHVKLLCPHVMSSSSYLDYQKSHSSERCFTSNDTFMGNWTFTFYM